MILSVSITECTALKVPSAGGTGLHTPKGTLRSQSGLHTPAGRAVTRSVGYYFDELRRHFEANNDTNRYAIICTKFVCQIYDGKDGVFGVSVDTKDSTSVRNLYLMMYSCGYRVEEFLKRFDTGEFASFDGTVDGVRLTTPPQFTSRSYVTVFAVGKLLETNE